MEKHQLDSIARTVCEEISKEITNPLELALADILIQKLMVVILLCPLHLKYAPMILRTAANAVEIMVKDHENKKESNK